MADRMQNYIKDLHEQYGKIVSFKLGTRTLVYVRDGPLSKQIFAMDQFSQRDLTSLPFARALIGPEPAGNAY